MQRYSRLARILALSGIVTGCLVSLNFTPTFNWGTGGRCTRRQCETHAWYVGHEHSHGEDAAHSHGRDAHGHSHGEHAGHAHSQENTVTLTDKAKANIGLKTAEADVRAIERGVQVTGNVIAHPSRQAAITPRIGGIVRHIHLSLGDTLKKGDVLLELESLDLQMAQIELIEAVAQKQSLTAELERLTEVFAKQIRRELQTRQID